MNDTEITKVFYANVNTQKINIIFPLLTNQSGKYQLIYASQLYGTFFCVFAKLNINCENLDSMDLHLVNYKGHINLGLSKETENGWSKSMDSGYDLALSLKAANGSNIYNSQSPITVICDTPLGHIKKILVSRNLDQLHDSANTTQQLGKEMFDSEFYGRDGEFIYRKPTSDEVIKDYLRENPGKFTGKTCNQTLLTIV